MDAKLSLFQYRNLCVKVAAVVYLALSVLSPLYCTVNLMVVSQQ